MSTPREGGIYASMKFPDYKYQEYPKWVVKNTGERIVVSNQAEELRVRSEIPEERPQTEVERERNAISKERDELAQQIAKLHEEMSILKNQALPKAPAALPPLPTPAPAKAKS